MTRITDESVSDFFARTRREELKIILVLNKSHADKHQAAIDEILRDQLVRIVLFEGDKLRLKYEFCIDYIGEVERKLRAVRSILDDRDVVANVTIDELKHGESLLVSIIDHIRSIALR